MSGKRDARPFRLGLVGLDPMGVAMTRRLRARNWQVTVWGQIPETFERVRESGAVWGASAGAVRAASDIVILCLPDEDAVERACLGDGGLVASKGAHIVVDCSSTGVELTRSLGEGLDVAWLDAPASGSPEAAERGQITLLAGGTEELFDWVRPVLSDLATTVTLMGPVGAGQTAKLIAQAIIGTSYVLMAEVLAQVKASGMDGEKLVHALRGGLADSVVLQRALPQMLSREFADPKARTGQLTRDLLELRSFNAAAGLDLPLQEIAIAQYRRFADEGNGDKDIAAIIGLYDPDGKAT